MTYTIEQVSPEVKNYTGKFGVMRSYRVKFKDMDQWVEMSQKPETPEPKVGDSMDGTIDVSGQYGPKFKKDFSNKPQTGGKKEFDSFTMYLSYAKDLVVSLQTTTGFDDVTFKKLLQATLSGGITLYNNRPDAKPPEPKEDVIKTEELDPFKQL